MSNYKEIVTKTVIGKAKKISHNEYKLTPEASAKQALEENKDLVPASDNGEYEKFFVTCVKAFDKWFDRSGYALYPEFKFSYLKDGVINNGSIDLLMVKDDEYIIIDYKSDEAEYIVDDDVFEQTLREKYDPQLKSYEEVVSTIQWISSVEAKIEDKKLWVNPDCGLKT